MSAGGTERPLTKLTQPLFRKLMAFLSGWTVYEMWGIPGRPSCAPVFTLGQAALPDMPLRLRLCRTGVLGRVYGNARWEGPGPSGRLLHAVPAGRYRRCLPVLHEKRRARHSSPPTIIALGSAGPPPPLRCRLLTCRSSQVGDLRGIDQSLVSPVSVKSAPITVVFNAIPGEL